LPTTDDLLSSLLDEFKAFAKVQEGKAVKRNERREKEGIVREKSPLSIEIWIQNPRSELHCGELVHK